MKKVEAVVKDDMALTVQPQGWLIIVVDRRLRHRTVDLCFHRPLFLLSTPALLLRLPSRPSIR